MHSKNVGWVIGKQQRYSTAGMRLGETARIKQRKQWGYSRDAVEILLG